MRNAWIRRVFGKGLILSVAVLLGGCPVPLPPGYTGTSRENLDVEVESKLTVGVTTREEVLFLLGEPDGIARDDSWMAYGSIYNQGGVLFLLCGPYGGGCAGAGTTSMEYRSLIIKFDDSGLMTKAESVTEDCWEGLVAVGKIGGESAPCMQIDAPHDEPIGPRQVSAQHSVSGEPIAPQQMPDQQTSSDEWESEEDLRRLWWEYYWNPENFPLADLCTLAENGNSKAKKELGRLYEHGLRGLPKDKGYALFWYRSSGYLDDKDEKYLGSQLSGHEIQSANRRMDTWRPGDCEVLIKLQRQRNYD